MLKRFLFGWMALFCLSGQVYASSDIDAARDTIAQINHINWVVSKIKTYNNVLVLEEEYKQISPGRLNLSRIPDQKTLDKITEMLDLLHSMMQAERDLEHWKRTFEVRRKNAQFDFWTGRYQSTGDAVLNLSWANLVSSFNPVFSLSNSALDSYRSYTRYVQELEDEAIQKKFNFKSAQLERLHQLNKELLQAQWEMIQEYHFDDSLRVSDADIIRFVDALKDVDRARVYARIEAMKERFKIFPVYWYYLSSVALETGHLDEAMEACDTFFKVNRGLFRDDPMAGSVAMNKIYLLEKTEENKALVQELLGVIWKYNAGDVDWRKDYFAATIYNSYLGDKAMAEKVLSHAIATLESSLSSQLTHVNEILDKTLIQSEELEFADGMSLWICRRLMEEIKGGIAVYNEEGLLRICQNETTSNIEKLAYVGKMTTSKFWEIVGSEIKTINLTTKGAFSWDTSWNDAWNNGLGKTVYASIPIKWFLSGHLVVTLELVDGSKVCQVIEEARTKRKINDKREVVLQFDVLNEKLKQVDAVRLVFQHADYPLCLTFASATPYTSSQSAGAIGWIMNDGDFGDDNALEDLSLMEVGFKNTLYRIDFKSNDYKRNVKIHSWEEKFKTKFPNLQAFKVGCYEVNRGCVKEIECNADGAFKIYYENQTSEKKRPAVSIYLLNQYGVITKRIDDVWRFKRLPPNGTSESEWLTGDASAMYIDIEVAP